MSHTVRLVPSNRSFTVESDESVLEAALKAGVSLPYSCRSGSCGSCRCQMIEGEVSYPEGMPIGLSETEHEAGAVLACRAHAETGLVLEVQELSRLTEVIIKTLPARVMSMQRLNHDVMQVFLKLPAVERLDYLAGQYVDILLRDGSRRSFSLANAPGSSEELELHIRHVPGGQFTTAVFEEMKEKALVRVQGPLGSFFLREDSQRPIILVGGGTGFAPLKAIIEQVIEDGIGRPIHLYWGARDIADLYSDLPRQWQEMLPNFRFTPVLSDASDEWQGRRGWVHEAVLEDYPQPADHDVYMAGPPPMIEAGHAAFAAAGLPETQLFFDSFDFAPEVQAALDAQAASKASG